MKRFCVVLLFLPLFSVAQKKGFLVNGTLSGLNEKSQVFLTDANKPSDTLARATVVDGKFILKGKVPEPGLYNLVFVNPQKKGILFLDNSTVLVTGNVDEIQKLKVEGSPSHKDFEEFQKIFTPLFQKLNLLGEQVNSKGINDSLAAEGEKTTKAIQVEVDKFIAKKKSSYVSPFILIITAQLSNDIKMLEKRYASLAPNVRQGYYGKFVKDMLDKANAKPVEVGAVGTNAIDFTQNDPDGKPVTLSSFKGKYVLVDFWASWCGPCRQENPNVVNTYNSYKNKNFTVLGVSLDRAREPWLKAIKDDNLTWTHVSDLKFWYNAVAVKYAIQSIPQNFLISPDGKIIARNLRGPELPQRLGELLK